MRDVHPHSQGDLCREAGGIELVEKTVQKQISHKNKHTLLLPSAGLQEHEKKWKYANSTFIRKSRQKSCDKFNVQGLAAVSSGRAGDREKCHGGVQPTAETRLGPEQDKKQVGRSRSPVLPYPYQCWCLAQKLQKIALPQTSPPCRMAQALDSGPAASSALAQPDKEDSVWSEGHLSPDPYFYTHNVPPSFNTEDYFTWKGCKQMNKHPLKCIFSSVSIFLTGLFNFKHEEGFTCSHIPLTIQIHFLCKKTHATIAHSWGHQKAHCDFVACDDSGSARARLDSSLYWLTVNLFHSMTIPSRVTDTPKQQSHSECHCCLI